MQPVRTVIWRAHVINKLINIGFGNVILASRVVAVLSPDSAPMKRLKEEARNNGKLLDATHGRRTRAIIVTDSDRALLYAIQPETAAQRFTSLNEGESLAKGGVKGAPE